MRRVNVAVSSACVPLSSSCIAGSLHPPSEGREQCVLCVPVPGLAPDPWLRNGLKPNTPESGVQWLAHVVRAASDRAGRCLRRAGVPSAGVLEGR